MSFAASSIALGHVRWQQAKPRVGARRGSLDQRDRGDEIRRHRAAAELRNCAAHARSARPTTRRRHFDVTEAVVLFAASDRSRLGYHARPV